MARTSNRGGKSAKKILQSASRQRVRIFPYAFARGQKILAQIHIELSHHEQIS